MSLCSRSCWRNNSTLRNLGNPSQFHYLLLCEVFKRNPLCRYLLGDQGYLGGSFTVLIPFRDDRIQNEYQADYNAALTDPRLLVEHGNGVFKEKFPAIGLGLRKNSAKASQDTIYAAAVLHNIRIGFETARNPSYNLPSAMRTFPDFNFDEKMSQSYNLNPYDLEDNNCVRDRVISIFFTP